MAERFETGRWEKTTCQCPKWGDVRTCGPANHHAVGTMLQSAVIRLARRWTTRVDEVLAEGGLNAGQLAVLNLLAQRPSGLIQREAADALALSEAVMSTRVTGLLAAGLVERQALKGDRRAHLLRLTDSGREAAKLWSACASCVQYSVESSVSLQDISTALAVLSRMNAALGAHDCSVATDADPAPQPRGCTCMPGPVSMLGA